ncbi:DUF159 family protein [Paraoerskovia sediminicola]|uniref:Abasic site processing protein n=1 Tax=Paraoerskovia sediminicola TaxID=1138587 RepID=A0ABN6X8A7_9CELL|nr:SOS response-associated peptidase [Paraoerskovia sediminicola]BDZ40887.1 DUF159 family protein [Paraoerskovia sediminicola]
MCGRYASFTDAQDLADELAVAEIADDARMLPPSWNVAPTDPVRIVVERAPRPSSTTDSGTDSGTESGTDVVRSLQVASWGLVPSWSKDRSRAARAINARSETLAERPTFAKAFAARRCLVPADAYYEWRKGQTAKQPKQPHAIAAPDGHRLTFAGLYEFWRDPERSDDDPDRWLVSTTIVTRAAVGDLTRIHDRMPVVVPATERDLWLDPAVGSDAAASVLASAPVELVARPVSRAVGSVANDGPHLLEPV